MSVVLNGSAHLVLRRDISCSVFDRDCSAWGPHLSPRCWSSDRRYTRFLEWYSSEKLVSVPLRVILVDIVFPRAVSSNSALSFVLPFRYKEPSPELSI